MDYRVLHGHMVWITMAHLFMSGDPQKIDSSMDEGGALLEKHFDLCSLWELFWVCRKFSNFSMTQAVKLTQLILKAEVSTRSTVGNGTDVDAAFEIIEPDLPLLSTERQKIGAAAEAIFSSLPRDVQLMKRMLHRSYQDDSARSAPNGIGLITCLTFIYPSGHKGTSCNWVKVESAAKYFDDLAVSAGILAALP